MKETDLYTAKRPIYLVFRIQENREGCGHMPSYQLRGAFFTYLDILRKKEKI